MKERPILFSAGMIRALLDGEKSMTRRVVKPQPPFACRYEINGAGTHALCLYDDTRAPGELIFVPPTSRSKGHRLPCPYGQAGDLLWCRETHARDTDETLRRVAYQADGQCGAWWSHDEEGRLFFLRHGWITSHERQASRDQDGKRFGLGAWGGKWRPSIFMPRWASRLSLAVLDVSVERAQTITTPDAVSEGVLHYAADLKGRARARFERVRREYNVRASSASDLRAEDDPRGAFAALWTEINGPASWDSNPFCWVVKFERTT